MPHVTTSYFRRLYAYNRWANRRTFQSAFEVPAEEFERDLKGSFSSVRDTLVHIIAAEWVWLRRWKGVSPRSMPDAVELAAPEVIQRKWKEVEQEQASYIETLTDDDLRAIVRYTNTKGEEWEYPLWEMLVHVVNHSSYHRGQIATMLRQLGCKPASTDFLLFCEEGSS
jgi:uncharacterized damage-inducible protein DinB